MNARRDYPNATRAALTAAAEIVVSRGDSFYDARREFEHALINAALKYSAGSVAKASRRLGIHRNTAHLRLIAMKGLQ